MRSSAEPLAKSIEKICHDADSCRMRALFKKGDIARKPFRFLDGE